MFSFGCKSIRLLMRLPVAQTARLMPLKVRTLRLPEDRSRPQFNSSYQKLQDRTDRFSGEERSRGE